MSNLKLVAIVIWILICGLAFFLLLGRVGHSFLWAWPYIPLSGVMYYIIGVPPIILLEKGLCVTALRYRLIYAMSLIGFVLACGLFAGSVLPFGLIAPFFALYIFMGSWALTIIWFMLISRKYNNASFFARWYAVSSSVAVNIGLVAILAIWSR